MMDDMFGRIEFPGLAELLENLIREAEQREAIRRAEHSNHEPVYNWRNRDSENEIPVPKIVIGGEETSPIKVHRSDDDGEFHLEPIDDGKPDGNLGKNSFYEGEGYADEPKMPRSIFEILEDNGNDFSKIVFGNQQLPPVKKEIPIRPKKEPFVFIANNLTFLIKTEYPIVWETSKIVTEPGKWMFIAVDKSKNPKLDINEATKIANSVNNNEYIQGKIKEYLSGTEFSGIHMFPQFTRVAGENRFGFMFVLFKYEETGL